MIFSVPVMDIFDKTFRKPFLIQISSITIEGIYAKA